MKKLALILLIVVAAPLAAQQPPANAPDPFAKMLFPPELIMQRQAEIGLRDAQRDQISAELQKAQQTFTSVQWKIAAEAGKLEKLLKDDVVDEARVLAQVDTILGFEREVKRTHIALLVRIRNILNDEQRRRLMELRGD
jgi:Spy/CpxP family protein refolding chaperone